MPSCLPDGAWGRVVSIIHQLIQNAAKFNQHHCCTFVPWPFHYSAPCLSMIIMWQLRCTSTTESFVIYGSNLAEHVVKSVPRKNLPSKITSSGEASLWLFFFNCSFYLIRNDLLHWPPLFSVLLPCILSEWIYKGGYFLRIKGTENLG